MTLATDQALEADKTKRSKQQELYQLCVKQTDDECKQSGCIGSTFTMNISKSYYILSLLFVLMPDLCSSADSSFYKCIKHEKLLFAQKEVTLKGDPTDTRSCSKDFDNCFNVSALSSKYESSDPRIVVSASFPGPFHFIARGCTAKRLCESMCDRLNSTSRMRGSIYSCNVTCCNTSYCNGNRPPTTLRPAYISTEKRKFKIGTGASPPPLVCRQHLEITEPVRKDITGSSSTTVACKSHKVCVSLSGRSTSQLEVKGHPTVSASYKGPYAYNYQDCVDRDECLYLCQQVNSTQLRVKGSALSCTRKCCTTNECNAESSTSSEGSSQKHSFTMLVTSLLIVVAAEKGLRWMVNN